MVLLSFVLTFAYGQNLIKVSSGTQKHTQQNFSYNKKGDCFYYSTTCYKRNDFNGLVKKVVEDEIKKSFPKYMKDKDKKDLDYIFYMKGERIKIDLDDVFSQPELQKSLKKKLNQLSKLAKSHNIQTKLDTLIYQKNIWGFERGEYKVENENEFMEAGIIAFFRYLNEKLLTKVRQQPYKIEIMAVGFTDDLRVSKDGIDYHLSETGATVITLNGSCSGSHKTQPIYYNNNNHIWIQLGKKSYTQHKISKKIKDNCELSFARGFEAILYLKKYSDYLEKNRNVHFDYAYSGKGVSSIDSPDNEKRKIMIVLQQSRLKD